MIKKLESEILSLLKPYPYFATIPQICKVLSKAYVSIHYRLMIMVANRDIGYVKFGQMYLFYAPFRPEIKKEGNYISKTTELVVN